MAHAFQTIGQIISPWPSVLRLFAAVVRAGGGAIVRALKRWSHSTDCTSVTPVSPEWLLQHEILSNKHQNEA